MAWNWLDQIISIGAIAQAGFGKARRGVPFFRNWKKSVEMDVLKAGNSAIRIAG